MTRLTRKTEETDIELELSLSGEGQYQIETGIGFFDHMLALWSRHGLFDLKLKVEGDLEVDTHHTVEDTGIVMGQAVREELGERTGIKRYGQMLLPMDETLILVALDLGGRSYYHDNLEFKSQRVGDFPVELLSEFLRAVTNHGQFNLHLQMLEGGNTHHLLEGAFKGFARALDQALEEEPRLQGSPPSTKGRLTEDNN